jgi:putative FmdB family regulatory protein
MPQYDFVCQDCKKPFSKILTVAEYDKGKIVCPKCGSRKIEQQVSPLYPVTSSRSQNEDSRERVNLSASEEDDRARVLSDWEGEGGASGAEKEA